MIAFLLLLAPASAQARSSASYAYPESRIWTSVIRMVRVDFESPIVEKDKDAGYLLFNYLYSGKQYTGSVEVVPTLEKGEARVKVMVQINGMPSYVERMMLDKLEKKLLQEFGAPLVTPSAKDKKRIPGSSGRSKSQGDANADEAETDTESKSDDDKAAEGAAPKNADEAAPEND